MDNYKYGLDKVLDAKVTLFLADYLVMEEKIDQLKKQILEFTEVLPKEVEKKLHDLDEIFKSIPTFIGTRLDENIGELKHISESLKTSLENLTEQGLEEFLIDIENAKKNAIEEMVKTIATETTNFANQYKKEIENSLNNNKSNKKSIIFILSIASIAISINIFTSLSSLSFKNSDSNDRDLKALIFAKNYVLEKSSEKDKKEIERLFNEGGDIYLKSNKN